MTDETIFAAALEKPDPAERSAYLDAACKDDPVQRKRIDGLLAAHAKAVGFLERPAVAPPEPGATATRAYRTPEAEVGDGETRTQGELADADTDDALGFLAPPRRADSLGRLGHYEVLEVLGTGGFGIVYRAFDEVLQRVVAVKVLAPSMAATSPARKRFIREAQSAARIQHENVVRVHDVSRDDERLPYLVMEFISGETLQQTLDRKGPLEVPEVVRIGRQIADGLAAAHEKGLIHRDIKPSNILIDRGPQDHAKITDFGLARAADDASLTRSGVVAGTPMYMAPEQAKGEALDHRADLFSLGSVMYAMLTGRPPFRAETTLAVLKRVAEDTPRPIREIIPEVPEWLCRIVEKLHAKNPADRFQTAKEVAEVLADCERQLAAHKEVKDLSRIPEGKPTPAPARRRVPAWAIAVYCAAVVVLVSVSLAFPSMDQFRAFVEVLLVLTPVAVMITALRREMRSREATTSPRRSARWKWAAAVLGLVALVGAVVAFNPTVYLYATNRGELILDDADPQVEVTILQRGTVIHDRSTQRSFVLDADPTTEIRADMVTARGRVPMFRKDFAVKRGGQVRVNVAAEFAAIEKLHRDAIDPGKLAELGKAIDAFKSQTEGFVPLFNGEDLTGWKVFPADRTSWKVENGVLVGSGKPSHLFTERGNYGNFHLRMETRIKRVAKGGAVGVFARVPFEDPGMILSPYGSESLYRIQVPKLYDDKAAPPDPAPPGYREGPHVVWGVDLKGENAKFKMFPADEWFTHELILDGKNVTVRTAAGTHSSSSFAPASAKAVSGHLALQLFDDWSVVEFRKIEIKELPPMPEQLARDEAAKLNGEWIVRQGRVDQEALVGDDIAGMKLHLQNGKFILPIRDDSGYPWALTGIYTIDAAKKQLAFKFSHERLDVPAVLCTYSIDGDALVLDFPEPKVGDGATGSTVPFAPDRRVASRNNLYQIGVAMHHYLTEHDDTFPPAAITSPKDGKPLLSWRVALLPYLDQEALYKQFKLDEPWDSEHNKKLIDKMPKVFKTPGVKAEPGITHYRVFVGPGTAFEPRPAGAKGLGILAFDDGLSNTILVVEAATHPVVWTKPDDFPYDPKKPLPKLVGADSVATHVLMGDGSVWQILPEAWPAGIRDAIVRNNAVGPWNKAAWNRLFRRIPQNGPALHLEFRRGAPTQQLTALDREDLAKLTGEWLVRFAEHDGNPLAQKKIDALEIRFGDGEFEIRQPGTTNQKETGPFRIDAANKQLFLNFKHSPVPVRCAYRVDGDRLRLTFGSWDTKKPVAAADLMQLRDRYRTINNLKQLAIAMHNYNDELGGLPRAALTNAKAKDGKPLLSWRVAILPYIEQNDLYKQFKLDEPWDSPNNKKLIDKMPAIFATPAATTAEPGLTHYRVFTGPGTPFESIPNRDFGVQLTEIPDGTANTLLIVGAADPVIWTKPDDLPYDPKQPLPKLGATRVGIPVAMCDGTIGTLAPDVSEKALRALITRSGGETVSAPFLKPDPLETPPMYLECVRRGPVTDKERLQGLWIGESAESLGQPLPADRVKGMRLEFTGANIRVTQPGKPDGVGTFKLDADANPREIDAIRNDDEKGMRGIYRLDGDKLTVCMGEPGPNRPREFRTGPDTGPLLLVTLRRATPAQSNPAVLQPLKDAVAAHTRTLETVKARYEAGTVGKIELLNAEGEVTEARIKLAEAEGDAAAVVARLEDLVKQRQEERDLIAERVKAGVEPATVLNQADTRLSDAKVRLAKARPAAPPEAAPAPRPAAKLLRKFDPAKDETITSGFQNRFSWSFKASGEKRTLRLYEIADPQMDADGVLVFRAKMRTHGVALAYPEIVCRFPDATETRSAVPKVVAEGTTGLAVYEVRCPLKPGAKPDLIRLNLVLQGEADGSAELEEMGLWHLPVEQLHGRLAAPTTLPRKLEPARLDPVIAASTWNKFEWGFVAKPGQQTLRLLELENPATDEVATLVLRSRLSTRDVKGAYLQIVCCFPDGTETASKEPELIAEGDTNPTPYEVRHPLKKGERPYLIRVNLVLRKSDKNQSVHVQELELSQVPANPKK